MRMIHQVWERDRLSVVVSLHSAENPADEEWEAYLAVIKEAIDRLGLENVRAIAVTDGGAPSSAQRNRLNQLLGGRSVPGGVVTDSALVRGIVTALSWFNRAVKSFAP